MLQTGEQHAGTHTSPVRPEMRGAESAILRCTAGRERRVGKARGLCLRVEQQTDPLEPQWESLQTAISKR